MRGLTMMFWYGNGMGGWGYALMTTSMILFWALLVLAGVLLFRHYVRPAAKVADPDPERVLAQRFARGDLDEDEFRKRLDALRGTGTDAAS